MKVILLAGGRGERLKPLTDTLPKPMVNINGKPLIQYSIELFKFFGFTDFIITLCYLPDKITKYFGNGKKFGVNIGYAIEDAQMPLGTAGSLKSLRSELKQTFIICSSDILRVSNIKELVDYHKTKKAIATIGVYKNSKPDPKSIIVFDKTGRIKSFIERPKKIIQNTIFSNASIYILEPKVLNYISEDKTSDFGIDVFPNMIKNNEKVFAYIHDGYFLDVGNNEKIEKAKKDIKKGILNYEK